MTRSATPEVYQRVLSGDQDAKSGLLGLHQRLALKRQAALRLGLTCSAGVEFLLYHPRVNHTTTATMMTAYTVYAVGALILALRDVAVRHSAWAVPLVDLPVFAVLLSVSGAYSDPDWSNPFTSVWLLMVVIMSAFQLRPAVTAVTGALATVFYCVASIVGHAHASPDLHFTLGHALSIALVSLASVLLSRIQQSRVRHIAELAHHRASMLATTLTLADRERKTLAETLHDGPLQSVLAARLDIGEAAETAPQGALDRADEALRDAARQLRSSVTELHPSVLDRTGLRQALTDLAHRAARRGKFTIEVNATATSAGRTTDRLLYNCARELLTNTVKHASATHVDIRFDVRGPYAHLTIADDGIGLPLEILEERVAQGHIGLASQHLRLQEAGGTLTIQPGSPTGTLIEIRLPVDPNLPNA
ncbi:sensor histidine kinase [Streptomyces vinaceus]|uniref:sensor histidine kinase n=1 Tax=Streptomyces vinaceus TaxID=1960 RepID=UPI0035D573B1